ncbi:hypothetical protein WOLCODRAFT_164501 [Wolfiporia cocos MD-104 SS10]|uniref:Uncharacterized protein n=1 Tax=Wolfiporia cocos (strain MD-104) TaxID=742152 RepID=A0A2H3JMU2_WOLCO|nr:hypothetical protein WOLCODRAFT_164501 [Wolfiporia cocos MD-104 SS10]
MQVPDNAVTSPRAHILCDHGLIEHILGSLYDLNTLAATIQILERATASPLSAARRVAQVTLVCRRGEIPQIPAVSVQECMEKPITRNEAEVIVEQAQIVQEIEDNFSWCHKDRRSRFSQLTKAEAKQFHTALYHFWVYCQIYENNVEYSNEVVEKLTREREEFLESLELNEMLDVRRILVHLEIIVGATINRRIDIDIVVRYGSTLYVRAGYVYSFQGPQVVWENFKSNTMCHVSELRRTLFYDAAARVFVERTRGLYVGPECPIIHAVNGVDDRCSYCQEVFGVELWGPEDWPMLRALIGPYMLGKMLPGQLPKSYEPLQISEYIDGLRVGNHVRADPIPYEQLMVELIEREKLRCMLRTEDGPDVDVTPGSWSTDGRYCIQCIADLFRRQLWRWWLERKQQG